MRRGTPIWGAAAGVVLTAFVLRALVPVGWMPDPARLGLIPCPGVTAQAPASTAHHEHHHGAKPDAPATPGGHSKSDNGVCPFAAAPGPSPVAAIALPLPLAVEPGSIHASVVWLPPLRIAVLAGAPRGPPRVTRSHF